MGTLTNVMSMPQTEYKPSLWTQILHQIPHVNISLHKLGDPRFRPDDELYLESLGIIGSVPAAWLILTLLILLIYLLTRCCDTKNNKKRKSRPIRCCLSFFSLLCCSALAAGFYGNHHLHVGVEHFSQATTQINRLIAHAQKQTSDFNDILSKKVELNLNKLYDGPFQSDIYENQQAHYNLINFSESIFQNVSHGLTAMDQIRLRISDPTANHNKPISVDKVSKSILAGETYRWPVTMGLLGLFSLFCLLLFVGAIVHSRGILILFSVCGLFSIILLWLLASIYITLAVAMADLCTDPTPWIQSTVSRAWPNITKDISDYYLRCKSKDHQSPFRAPLMDAQMAVLDIDRAVRQVDSISRQYYTEPGLKAQLSPSLEALVESSAESVKIIGELNDSMKCNQVIRFYNDALNAVCHQGLSGLLVMLISAASSALIFTILVWCNSHTWIYFKHKGKYVKVEDQDPYMPLSTIDRGNRGGSVTSAPTYQRSRTIHTPPQTPPYHGTLNGHGHNGHSLSQNGTLDARLQQGPPTLHAGIGYGHVGGNYRGHTNPMQHAGTLGRPPKPQSQAGPYHGMDALPATMTLGRKGHYASLRNARNMDQELPMLGPNQGQYATLSKQCKTLESSDFY